MSKTIKLSVNGQDQTFSNIERITTNLLATDERQVWIPKDEAVETANFVDIQPTANGLYRVAEEGETAQTIQHDDGTVTQIIEADGIKSVTPNVPGSAMAIGTIEKNGTYDAKNYNGRSADGFGEFTVDVQPKTAPITFTKDGYYQADTYGLKAFSKVKVNVRDAIEEPYRFLNVTKNGTYEAEDMAAVGLNGVHVDVKKNDIIPGKWTKLHQGTLPRSAQNTPGCVMGSKYHLILNNLHFIYDLNDRSTSVSIMPRPFIYNNQSKPCLIVHNGELHLLGGQGGSGTDAIRQHWVYHEASNVWEQLESLPEPPIAAVSYHGEIWIYTPDSKLKRLTNGILETMYEMEDATTYAKMCVYKDRIFIVGGSTQNIISFHPVSGARYEVELLPYTLYEPQLVVHNDKLRILGNTRGYGVESQYDRRYMTDLSYDGRFLRHESLFVSGEVMSTTEEYLFYSNYVNVIEYNGRLHAIGASVRSNTEFTDNILEETQL